MVKGKKALEYLIDYLVHNGIDTFFLVTGGAIVPTIDYIGRKEEVKYFCFQNEQPASMAAEAYYRTSGKIGVVLSTSGPGAQNLLNGICGCWYESIPCLFITGQVSTYESLDSISAKPRQVGFQETPVAESFKYFTKFSSKITKIEDFESTLKEALSKCFEGRMGPSLIDFPVDIQNSIIEDFKLDKIKLNTNTPNLSENISILNDQIKKSKRPLLLVGHGIKLSNATKEIKELISKLNIPIVTSWGGFGVVDHENPQFIGDIGVYGSRGGNYAIQNCDLLISIGSRLDTRQTGGSLSTFSRKSYKIMVDIDPNELNKDRGVKIDLPIESDAKHFLKSWLESMPQSISEWSNIWQKYKSHKENRSLKNNILTSYEFLEELNTQLPEDAVIIPESGGNLVWSMQSIVPTKNQTIFSNFGNSSMGYGLPAGIGAAIASNRPIISINGDGGFQMNIQELQTIKQYNLPVKMFVINNNCYGIIKQFQDSYFDSRYIATDGDDYTSPDFVKIAKAYGITTLRATKSTYKEVINLAMREKGSILVEVIIDKEQKLTPKLEFGNPLEDMSPYLSDKEIKDNMIIDMIPRKDNSQGWVTLDK